MNLVMEKLIVLGTGNALATHCYNTCFAIDDGSEAVLVDTGGGNGILSRLEQAGMDPARIHHLIVTHEHCDHLLGVVWMVRKIGTMIRSGKYEGNLHLYCHDGLVKPIQAICGYTLQKKFTNLFGDRIIFHPVEDGQREALAGRETVFFDIHSTKARQFGFSMTLPQGEVLTCLGDEPYNPLCERYVRGCHWLLCEAFCLYGDRDRFKPYEKHHSTVREACQLAAGLKVPNLVLWHTEDSDIPHRKERYTAEGRTFYHGNLLVPDDLDVIVLE